MRKILEKLFSSARKKKGFSLIELSVVISVAAAATVGFLSWTQPPSIADSTKSIETRDKIREISRAMEIFRVRQGRFPCPADPYIAPNNSRNSTGGADAYVNDFGMEDLDTITETSGTITQGIDCPNIVGSVPVHSLGLSMEYLMDGWERRFTYHISDSLCGSDAGTNTGVTATASSLTGCTSLDYESKTGNITVTDGSSNLTTEAAYVIVSHGANGTGAFLPSGVKSADSVNANELENSDDYSSIDNIYVRANHSATFDDIVYFKTKVQVERLTDSSGKKHISVADCELNSQALKNITKTEMDVMDSQLQEYKQASANTGHEVSIGVMKAIQTVCVSYYGAVAATVKTANDWSGAQCPGNNDPGTNGSTYCAATDQCTCLDKSWDGSCTSDWSVCIAPSAIAGLILWLDATDSSTVINSGGAVSAWNDKSSGGNNLTQGTPGAEPTTGTQTINGLNVLSFDGGDYLATINTPLPDGGYTVFVVAQHGVNGVNDAIIAQRFGGNGLRLQLDFSPSNNIRHIIRDDAAVANGSTSAGTFGVDVEAIITAISLANRSSNLYINGSSPVSVNNSLGVTAAGDGFAVGSILAGSLSLGLVGEVGEIIAYNTALSTADHNIIGAYLSDKWGITWTTVP